MLDAHQNRYMHHRWAASAGVMQRVYLTAETRNSPFPKSSTRHVQLSTSSTHPTTKPCGTVEDSMQTGTLAYEPSLGTSEICRPSFLLWKWPPVDRWMYAMSDQLRQYFLCEPAVEFSSMCSRSNWRRRSGPPVFQNIWNMLVRISASQSTFREPLHTQNPNQFHQCFLCNPAIHSPTSGSKSQDQHVWQILENWRSRFLPWTRPAAAAT